MLYLAIDQHRKQLTVNLRNEEGEVVLKRQVSTEWERVRAFLDDLRQRSQRVHHAHNNRFHDAPHRTSDKSQSDTYRGGDEQGDEGGKDGNAPTVQDAGVNITPQLICTQPMLGAGRLANDRIIRLNRIIRG